MPAPPTACMACARAKRRCGKEQPACRRCRVRGEQCDYTPEKRPGPSDRSRHASPISPAAPLQRHSRGPQQQPSPPLRDDVAPAGDAVRARASSPPSQSTRQCLAWFLGAHTWKIEHRDSTLTLSTSFGGPFLRRFITNVQAWLGRWTTTGGCPFIHAQLYAACFPADLQAAYTTYIAYTHRTPANTETILRIVEDQVSKLVADSGARAGEDLAFAAGPSVPCSTRAGTTSLLDQLARLQALVVYQVVGLFDGDIRARHLAEGRLALLIEWSYHLLDSARQKFAASPGALLDMTVALRHGPMDSLDHPWYLWLLTESIRRTWLVATAVEAIYCMMQRGWHPCPGGAMLTTRRGIWSAAGSQAWETLCTQQDVGFMRCFEMERLFADARPGDVDEFARAMLEITCGPERMEAWMSA